jgi:hypothetical protein
MYMLEDSVVDQNFVVVDLDPDRFWRKFCPDSFTDPDLDTACFQQRILESQL